tara:strand:- start:125 stop:472 length:348 start_codon:yes stop_codon:yes gene_type:complete
MSNSNKKTVYSLPLGALEELLEECETQLGFSEEVLIQKLSDDPINRMLASLLCEFYSSSNAAVKHLVEALEVYEKEDKNQVFISAESMLIIESALVSRYLVSKELLKYNVSLAIN